MKKVAKKNIKSKAGSKVFVGMSGGVDSSVSALLLKKQGYDVHGVFVSSWTPPGEVCQWKEDRRDAMRVAAYLGIPLITLDAEKEYKHLVVDEMIKEYKRGNTPNPDILCNREIKFGILMKFAMEQGADFIATGHYAKLGQDKSGEWSIQEPKDKEKDQTYFLWAVKQELYPKIIFPLGDITKVEVRKIAAKAGLPVAQKKDSQGVCFLGPIDMKEFVSKRVPHKKGAVLDAAGKKVGTHDGVRLYTVGERHGFSHEGTEPLYVVGKSVAKNTLTVDHGPLKERQEAVLEDTRFNSSSAGREGFRGLARVRHRGALLPVEVSRRGKKWSVIFPKGQFLAPGQSAVFYDGKRMIGGGIMASVRAVS